MAKLDHLADEFDRHLYMLIKSPLETEATLEEISSSSSTFYADRPASPNSFTFEHVISADQRDNLLLSINRNSDIEEDWNYAKWINYAFDPSKKMILCAVTGEGDDGPMGFAAWEIKLTLRSLHPFRECSRFEEAEPWIAMDIDLHGIYVSPTRRNKGYATALKWVFEAQVADVLRKLISLPDETLQAVGNPSFDWSFGGSAESAIGAVTGISFYHAAAGALDMASEGESCWLSDAELIDHFDTKEYLTDDGELSELYGGPVI